MPRFSIVSRASRAGFTLIEVLLVVSIITVLTMMGNSIVDGLLPRYRAKQAAQNFAHTIERMRVLAIAHHREYRLLLVDFDADPSDADGTHTGEYWLYAGNKARSSDTWELLPLDADDGSDDYTGEGKITISSGGQNEIRGVSILEWSTITGPGSSNSDAIVFSPRGWVTNPVSDFDAGYIKVEFVNRPAYVKGRKEVFQVYVSRGGMTRVDFQSAKLFGDFADVKTGIDSTSQKSNATSSP
jgi:prepilin-type N-terminal cleavage/methylation domain-containing protein